MGFKKSILFTFVNVAHSIFFSLSNPRADQNKMMLSIWPLWIRSKKCRKNVIITNNIITIKVIQPSPGQFKTLPSQP